MDDGDRTDYDRAASAYLIWPLSLFALAREQPGTSTWARIHTRQAAMYGLLVTIGFILILALPLFIVIAAPTISPETTVTVYATGLVIDVVSFLALAGLTLAYAARAQRGELFSIPVVSALADRIFRLRR